jgi:ring-1,2-phenylacetyl-CoA epoxidase subunit PaaC
MNQETKTAEATQRLAYTLQLADNILILAQRLGEWCGHGPILEQDIALTNTALDHIGGARSLYQYAAEQYNALPEAERKKFFTSPALEQRSSQSTNQPLNQSTYQPVHEDDLAYLRDAWDFRNVLLVEQPNEDWAFTIARSFFMDCFHFFLYSALRNSNDETLAAVAEKSLKEVSYHLKWSSEWVIRLGDGTEESAAKMQAAIDERWPYIGELFEPSEADKAALAAGYGAELSTIKTLWEARVQSVLEEAKLKRPAASWMHRGGKQGIHSEHLGYILAEMQFMQRAYPGMEW